MKPSTITSLSNTSNTETKHKTSDKLRRRHNVISDRRGRVVIVNSVKKWRVALMSLKRLLESLGGLSSESFLLQYRGNQEVS